MQRLTDRSVLFSEDEMTVLNDAHETWVEGTDPYEYVLNVAVLYGVTVSDEFAHHLADRLVAGSVQGYVVGTPFAGSTITHVTNEGAVHLANGHVISIPA